MREHRTGGTDLASDADGLTVGRVARALGVTVRALHHWDETGLARPSCRSAAGYRLYTVSDVERLRRIILYRELGLGLDGIRSLLDDPSAVAPDELRRQRERIRERIARLQELDVALERMIAAHERGLLLTPEEQREVFGEGWDPAWAPGARRRWGTSAQWAQYAERAAQRTSEEWRAVADAAATFERDLVQAFGGGVAPGDQAADELVERHREEFGAYFPLSRSMQVCLARTYTEDPAFAAHYDGLRPGLARWFRAIVEVSARAHGIDPETAGWE